MTRVYDRSTGKAVADLNDRDYERLRGVLESFGPSEDHPPIDPELLDRLHESGMSRDALLLLRQALHGRDSFDLGLKRN